MTDPEKLQQLFQAALKAPAERNVSLARAFPTPAPRTAAASVAEPVKELAPAPESPAPVAACAPTPNAGLNDATSAELGALLDGQIARKDHKRRPGLIGILIVVIGLTGAGLGWFVQPPARMQAGVSANQDGMKDVNMDAEMQAMMGGEGKTTGESNQILQSAFGKKIKAPAPATKAVTDQSTAGTVNADSLKFN